MKKTTKAKHERNNLLHSLVLLPRGRLVHRLAECNDTQVRVGVDDTAAVVAIHSRVAIRLER